MVCISVKIDFTVHNREVSTFSLKNIQGILIVL